MTGSFEGVGSLQYTPDNKYFYAYSGEVTLAGSLANQNYLEFDTEGEYLIGNLLAHGSPDGAGGNDFSIYVYFNDIIVLSQRYINNYSTNNIGNNGIPLIVPPFTNVKLNLKNEESGATVQMGLNYIGKVKGTIEQTDLEAITDGSKWAQ